MARACVSLVLSVALSVACAVLASAEKVSNAYGAATATTRSREVEVDVDIAAAHQDPGADPFEVQIICVDSSGLYKWVLTLDAGGHAAINLAGHRASASYYGADSEVDPGISFSVTLPPPLVNPDDRLLISIDSEAITASGPVFTLAIDAYRGQPLRMDTLRVTLAVDAEGNLVLAATNLTHVPLIVPLASLVLGLAPTPDWIPETTPDIRWTPNPPLSEGILALAADETITTSLPMPAIPAPSAVAYETAMTTLYAGMVDLYPGDYLVIGFPVAWGISWSYLPVVLP